MSAERSTFAASAGRGLQQVRGGADRRQRIAQLVREHRQKVVLAAVVGQQLFLRPLLFVDVRAGAHPPHDLALLVAHGQRPSQHPAVLAGPVPQPVLDLVGLAGGQAVPPHLPGARLVFRVEHAVPGFAIGRTRRHAGELVPLLVVVVVVAVRQRRPHHLRHGVGDGPELRLALAQAPLRQQALRHVLVDQHDLDDACHRAP